MAAPASEVARSREVSRMLRIRRTVLKMLMDRGYMVSNEEANITREEFERDFTDNGVVVRDKMQILASMKDDPAKKIMVFFPDASPLGTEVVHQCGTIMKSADITQAIIVYRDQVTSHARSVLAEMRSVELFVEEELMVNITEHTLVPTHVPLTEAEKKQLLARYRLKETQLPRMQESDPVARYYGLKRGNVVKIIRPSETAGRYVTYRLVF